VDISPPFEAVLEKVVVRLGDRVPKGALLARLDARPIRRDLSMAQAALQAAVAKSGKARIEQDHAQQRVQRREGSAGLVSQEDLETAKYNLLTGKAQVEVSDAEVAEHRARVRQLTERLAMTELRAPFSGHVALRYTDAGMSVRAGQAIIRLIADEGYRVRFAVPPESAATATVGCGLRFRVAEQDAGVPGEVTQVAQEVDSAAQMVFVEGTLTVPEALRATLRAGLVGRVLLDAPRGPRD